MLDITKMLHQIIDLELKIDDEKELMIGPETRKQTIFVDLDISLSNMAEAAGWYKVVNPREADKEDLLGIEVMLPNRIDRYIVQVIAALAHFPEHRIVLFRQAADDI